MVAEDAPRLSLMDKKLLLLVVAGAAGQVAAVVTKVKTTASVEVGEDLMVDPTPMLVQDVQDVVVRNSLSEAVACHQTILIPVPLQLFLSVELAAEATGVVVQLMVKDSVVVAGLVI